MAWRVALAFFLMTGVAEARRRKAAPPPPVAKPAPVAAPETLDGAIQLYQGAQFASSIAILDKVLRQTPDAATQIRANLYMGLNFLALGNEARATTVFQDLLDLDPDFTLPALSSPSVRQFFAAVKSNYKIIPVILHTPPTELDALNGAAFDVTVKRMRPGYEAKLFYRAQGTPKFSTIDLSRRLGDAYVARIPPALLVKDKGYSLEYYVLVTEGPEHALAKLRSASAPFVVPVSVPVQMQLGTPTYKKWWFWTSIVGALAVAGGATAAVLLTQQTPPTGQASISLKVLSR